MTKEHIGIAMALKIPMFVVVSKIDLAPAEVYNQTITTLQRILKGSACNMTPLMMKDLKDVDKIVETMPSRKICPIFSISNVTGEGIENLKVFIAKLPVHYNCFGNTNDES
jgi:GTPase